MNGHHESCECQPCTIGREIGMDRALELIREMRDMAVQITRPGANRRTLALDIADAADAFLKEHGQ